MLLYLIGFMGSGKTTVGKDLAQRLGYNFIDIDKQIEKEHNASLEQLFADHGEAHFRKIEQEALRNTFQLKNAVVATGGGTPCFFDNMEQINLHGLSVYLKMSAESLMERLIEAQDGRPLIKEMGPHQLREFISQTLSNREPFYMMANYKVKAKDLKTGALAEFLKEEMGILQKA